MKPQTKHLGLDQPLLHPDHPRPQSRRDFIRLGLRSGAATVLAPGLFSLFADPHAAYASVATDFPDMAAQCGVGIPGAGKIPFICFDLAGGANIAGSNVLVGKRHGQLDFLSSAGYSKLGIPGDMIPPIVNTNNNPATTDFINNQLGLAFHSDSAFLRGMLSKLSAATIANINGAVIPARSENDTGNNPHNPMYGLAKYAGVRGELLTLIGSETSDSGGNSVAPAMMIDPALRPTKIDRPSDVTGLVDTGQLVGLLSQQDAVAVMESVYRLSDKKLARVNTQLSNDKVVMDMVRCGYLKSADLAERYGNPATLDVRQDANIVGSIFSTAEFDTDDEIQKTASIMKLVVNGYAGAGTVTMGGFDYHTGDRSTGETRDFRAGVCMGACLEYAAKRGKPLMLYVFSDGALSSNGMVDNSTNGRGKGQWTGDDQATGAAFFLVYDPKSRPLLLGATAAEQASHQQLGWFRAEGDVETSSSPAANNVNLLVNTVLLNYMALHGESGLFGSLYPSHGLGNIDSMTAFQPIASVSGGVIT